MNRNRAVAGILFSLLFLLSSCSHSPLHAGQYELTKWKRGIKIRPLFQNGREMHLWFYEWNIFDAFEKGERTQGRWHFDTRISDKGRSAVISDDALNLTVRTNETGADLLLTVVNNSDHDWGEWAAIIPCLSPGPAPGSRKIWRKPRTTEFINHKSSYLTPTGTWEQLRGREIHFNQTFPADRPFEFSEDWPTADPPASEGILLRESNDGTWIAGIAWNDFVAVQGHNPWDCLHVAVRVGPLKRGMSKTIQGRIILAPKSVIENQKS